MGLQDCADSKIGDPGRGKTISGGERKRLSFATQILEQPPLLFCDEPTSGLDSYLANQVVLSLRKIAESGTTVLCTIHQPASDTFALFDNLILLAKGECAFQGTVDEAVDYFRDCLKQPCPKNYNPADHFINVLSIDPANPDETKQIVRECCDSYLHSSFYEKQQEEIRKQLSGQVSFGDIKDISTFDRPGLMKQTYWLFWRSMIINYRDPLVIFLKVAQVIFLGIIFGVIYLRVPAEPYIGVEETCTSNGTKIPGSAPSTYTADIANINGALFILLTNSSFTYVFFVVTVFPLILPIWQIEHFAGLYGMTTAFIATNLSELPTLIILPLIFTSIVYWMFGLVPVFGNFIMCYFILECVTQCAVSFGYMVSTFSANITIINALAAPLLIPLMIFGGFYLQPDSIPAWLVWIKYISWFYYGNAALLQNQWTDVQFDCEFCDGTVLKYDECPIKYTGEQLLNNLGFNEQTMWENTVLILILGLGFRLLGYIVLCFKFDVFGLKKSKKNKQD